MSMSALVEETPWLHRAACRGPNVDLFYPPNTIERKSERLERESRAKAICKRCEVIRECLEYAVRIREPHGIWGGLTERERKVFYY